MELILAVFGIGFCVNLFSSFIYDVVIKHEYVSGSFIWIIFLAFIIIFLSYLIYYIFLKYSPKKPIILKFFFNPMKYNDDLQEIEPELKEILVDWVGRRWMSRSYLARMGPSNTGRSSRSAY